MENTPIFEYLADSTIVLTVLIIFVCLIFILQQPFDYFGSTSLFIYLFSQHFPIAVKENITVDNKHNS